MANPAWIQDAISADPSAPNATTIALAYSTANLTAGSVLWCVVTWDRTNTQTATCADNTNGAWTAGPIIDDTTDGQMWAAFFFKNTAGGVKPTVTVTFGGSQYVSYRGLYIQECGPCNTTTQPDVTGVGNNQASPGTATDAVTSTAVTTVTNNAYIVGASIIPSSATPVITAGTNYNSRRGDSWTTITPTTFEDKVLATAGSVAATFTTNTTGGRYLTIVMAFRPVAATSAIKTFNGLAVASVKTVNGLAIASVKTRNGLA
jgi:hypothetical protein